ncbi:MAG: efflux RND transporter periplasmic adaptor subunit [Deltaproteobacteria bacterium]|nr:efflux RND transporter periplasmic adaptor subunit [Deltaproteobacteria bacterium]
MVKEGDDVKKGNVLATLLSTDLDAKVDEARGELAAARARLAEVASGARVEELQKAGAALDANRAEAVRAKADYERASELHRQGLLPDAAFDERAAANGTAGARVREAEAEFRVLMAGPKKETIRFHEESVKRAEATVDYYMSLLDKTIIRSPIDGRVIRKDLEEGESVVPETPILAVADINALRVNAEVDETDAGRIHLGDPVSVASDAFPERVYAGVVDEIADYVGPRGVRPNNPAKNLDMKVIQVKIRLIDKTPFKIGMTVDIKITPGGKRPEGG